MPYIKVIQLEDKFGLVESEFKRKCLKAMTECGEVAFRYAMDLVPIGSGEFSGSDKLHEKMSYEATETRMDLKNDSDHAIYVEMGTGKYVGGSAPWVYTPDGGEHFFRTEGQPPRPFVKPAVADHEDEYLELIEETLKG